MSMSMSMMMNAYVPPAIPDTWTTGASMSVARSYTGVASYSGNIYAMGGRDGSVAYDKFEIYNISTDSWITKTDIPTPREALSQVQIVGDKIYVCGSEVIMDIYDISLDSWSTGTSMPANRRHMGSAVVGTKIYYFGGDLGSNVYNDTYIYDTVMDSWSTGAVVPNAITLMAACSSGTNVYLFGGQNTVVGPATGYNWTQIYDTLLDSWSAGTTLPNPVIGATATVYGGKAYVFGGTFAFGGGRNYNQEYDISGNSWMSKTAIPTGVAYSSSTEYGGNIYLIGGDTNAVGGVTAINQIYTP